MTTGAPPKYSENCAACSVADMSTSRGAAAPAAEIESRSSVKQKSQSSDRSCTSSRITWESAPSVASTPAPSALSSTPVVTKRMRVFADRLDAPRTA